MPKLANEYLRHMGPLNLLFAGSSIGLLVVFGWMIYDDYDRGWKGYQKQFSKLSAAKTRAEIQAAEQAVDQGKLAELQSRLEEAKAAADQRADDLEAGRARVRDIEIEIYGDDLIYRKLKSTFDARKFDYEEALHAGSPAADSRRAEMDELERQLEEYRIRLLGHEKRKDEVEAVLRTITADADAAREEIAELTSDLDRLRKKLDKAAPTGLMRVAVDLLNAPMLDFVAPTIKIRQVILEKSPIDINFAHIPRADRCQTCHMAADLVGYEDDVQPFRTHSRLDLFVGGSSPHPIERFGCTPCHAGRDRAVDFNYAAHTPNSPEQKQEWEHRHDWERSHHWDFPMLARGRTESGCLKCHQGVVSLPEAPRLNRGLALVDRYGCYGCHKLRGFLNRPKVGPILTRITAKTTEEWLAHWVKNPKAFRPSTRMPRFFGLANNRGEDDVAREDAEIIGITAYLTSKSEPLTYPPLPGRGDPTAGETLVKTIGCMGCHAIEKDEVPADVLAARARGEAADPIAWERRFGPDLSLIGSKARPEWIYRWIQDPRSYNPDTRMPDMRLTPREALDITAYLMTLKDETAGAERAAAPQPQPEARDRTLLAYLAQRQPPEDARAALAGMSDDEKDILLGQRTIARYGCFGCHLIPGFENTPPIGVGLSQEGSKHASLLYFGYVPIEHTAPAWFFQKLKSPRSFDEGRVAEFYDRLRMPRFDFTDEEADAITLILQSLTREQVPLESVRRLSPREEAVEAGRRLVRDHNCLGCHVLDGSGGAIRESIARNLMAEGRTRDEANALVTSFAPPILDGEGDKVQPAWLFKFFQAPTPIRPWLTARMPSFGMTDAELSTLVHHFAAREDRVFPFQTLDREPLRRAELRAAVSMFGPDYFSCWNCHQQGARKPEGPPEGWAPDLTLAHSRLNPDWIARWIANPQKLMPGTKMPTYYDPEDLEGSAPPDILGGDPQKQIDALARYVFMLGHQRSGAVGAQP